MRTRRIVRLLFFIILVLLVGPLLLPLPPVGVEAATLADPGGFFAQVNGLSTYVLAQGPEDGEPLVLLHGWGASTFSWRENMGALAEAGYRVVAFDRPPYGLSAKTGDIPYSPSALADFTAAVLDELSIEQATLVGQSQGGGVIGHFAVRYPQRVNRLVFVSGVPRPTDDPAPTGGGAGGHVGDALGLPPFIGSALNFPPFLRWAQIGVRAFVTPDFAARILRTAYHDPAMVTDEVAYGYSRQLRVIGWDEALLNQLRDVTAAGDPITTRDITAISVPILIVWGEDDTWVPIEAGRRFHELRPGARWVSYPDAGHLPMEEAPARFNADLLAFLADNPLPAP